MTTPPQSNWRLLRFFPYFRCCVNTYTCCAGMPGLSPRLDAQTRASSSGHLCVHYSFWQKDTCDEPLTTIGMLIWYKQTAQIMAQHDSWETGNSICISAGTQLVHQGPDPLQLVQRNTSSECCTLPEVMRSQANACNM